MKKIFIAIMCIVLLFSGCVDNAGLSSQNSSETHNTDILMKGDQFSVTGIVEYSDEPSDIGQEYCFITGVEKIEYYYTDIYDEESKWSSNVFYTQDKDTEMLKEYVGQKVKVSGVFDAECHGIPYITNITAIYK